MKKAKKSSPPATVQDIKDVVKHAIATDVKKIVDHAIATDVKKIVKHAIATDVKEIVRHAIATMNEMFQKQGADIAEIKQDVSELKDFRTEQREANELIVGELKAARDLPAMLSA